MSSAPLMPFTLMVESWFVIWWWKIAGAKWSFDIQEDCIIPNVLLPAPTTSQVQSYCGMGVIKSYQSISYQWVYSLPESVLLVPNMKYCEPFSDDSFIGLRCPVRTVDSQVTIKIE